MFAVYLVLLGLSSILSCPLKTVDSRSGCYCGIEIDGTNYIQCQPYSIEAIPEFTRSYVHDTLNLSHNFIRTITNQSLSQLKVKKIYLQQNLIESIDKHAFQHHLLNYLEELHLDMLNNGSLEFLCYGSWGKLRLLALNGFNFHQFQSCLGAFQRLETLIIQNSYIQQLSYHIYKLPSLVELTLVHNQLEYLHFDQDLLTYSSSIRRLNLTDNQLRTIPNDLFYRIPQLITLDLSHNLIENLPIIQPIAVLHLNLSHNLINYLSLNDNHHQYDFSFNPLCTLERSQSNLELTIRSATRLHCDCRLAFFLHKNLTEKTQLIGNEQPFGNDTKCATPAIFAGLYLRDLTYEQLFAVCSSVLPENCREVTRFKQIEMYSRELIGTTTTTRSSTEMDLPEPSTSTTQGKLERRIGNDDGIETTPRPHPTVEPPSLRLTTFSTTYQHHDLIVFWDFDSPASPNLTSHIQFQIIVEQESLLSAQIIRRSGPLSLHLKQYIISHIPPNKTYYVCLLLTRTSYGTDKYCRETRTITSTTTSSTAMTTTLSTFILSKQAFVHLLFTNRSVMFGFLFGTILTTGLLLTLAFLCHLRAKRQRCQRAASALFHYQHPSLPPPPQQQHYLYAERIDDDGNYSNSIFSSLSSSKYNHSRKNRRRPGFPTEQAWYRRGLDPLPTVPSAPRCCFHHVNTPDTTMSSSATARRLTTLSSQYSNGMDREPMTSTSVMSSTSLDEPSQTTNSSPGKHVYEELADETTMLRHDNNADFFL